MSDSALHTPPAAAPPISWRWHAFDELSLTELYTVLQLREAVFVVEQSCPYHDIDGSDPDAWHLMGWTPGDDGPMLAAYARVFPPGIKYPEASIGRVITNPAVRRAGLGKVLMVEAIRRSETMSPRSNIRIGAQMRLERFYEGFGFRRVSEPYDEDGIMHIEMLMMSRP